MESIVPLTNYRSNDNRLFNISVALYSLNYSQIVLCIKKPKTQNQHAETFRNRVAETIRNRVISDRSALKTHLASAVLGLANICRVPDVAIQRIVADQKPEALIEWCKTQILKIEKIPEDQDVTTDEDS